MGVGAGSRPFFCGELPGRRGVRREGWLASMLMLDWFGCLLTGCALAILLPGQRRLFRATVAILVGELGRALLVFLGGGQVVAVTVGGAFTQMQTIGFPASAARLGGLFVGALLGLLAGPGIGRDLLLYALYASMAALLWP